MGRGGEVRPEIAESGKRLATFTRKGFARGGKPDIELRVTLDEYEGKPFISIRQWEMAYGRMVPTKKGTSIRMAEAPGIIAALERALSEVNEGGEVAEHGDDVRRPRPPREPRDRRPRRPDGPTLPAIEPEAVDEFDEYRKHPRGSYPRG